MEGLEQELVKDEQEERNEPCARGNSRASRTVKWLPPATGTKLDEAPCSVVRPHSHGFCTVGLRPEDVHGPDHILPADGALAHPLPAFGTGDHVTALQQHAVDDGVHADSTQVLIGCQLSLDAVCWGEEQIVDFICSGAFSETIPVKRGGCAETQNQRLPDITLLVHRNE